VAEFLSDAWVAELDAAVRSADGLACDPPLVVETVVREPDGERGYQLQLGPAGASITRPGATPADVVLVTDRATAWALHQGAVRAQDAFARGALKVRGRPELLAGHAEVFVALEHAVTPVRARTTATPDR
jgi:hypothetical protein